jgi:hypothetical protein
VALRYAAEFPEEIEARIEMYPARLARALRERDADAEGVDERGPLRGLADAVHFLVRSCG